MRGGMTQEYHAIIDGGTVAGLTDGQLLDRFVASPGVEAELAFAALVMRHGPLVFGTCQSLLRSPHDAEDAFQATFIVLARKAGSIRQPDRLGPWLYGVAHQTARRLRHKNARRRTHEVEAAVESGRTRRWVETNSHPATRADRDEVEVLHREIERLPMRYRTAIVLCDLQGFTHEEVARRLGCRVGTISSQVSRARARLRQRLGRRGVVRSGGIVAAALDTTRPSVPSIALARSAVKNVMSLSPGLAAGSVPASILGLAQGVLRSMFMTKLGLGAATLVGLGTVATGVGFCLGVAGRDPGSPTPQPGVAEQARADPKPVAATTPGSVGAPQAQPPAEREAEAIVRSATHLSRIARAIHAHLDANNLDFPAAAIVDAKGQPLLSWRVAILPYLGEKEKALYGQFHPSEPWDSPHNKALLAKMPDVYAPAIPKDGDRGKGVTHYLGFVGGGALFDRDQPVNIKAVTDGTVSTLMVAEAVTGVPWTKPQDLDFAGQSLLDQLGGQFRDGFVGVTADGFTRLFKKTLDPALLVEITTRGGGEIVDLSNAGEGIQVR